MSQSFMIKGTKGYTLVTLSDSNKKTSMVLQCYHLSPKLLDWFLGKKKKGLKKTLQGCEPCPIECPRSLQSGAKWVDCYARKTPLTLGASSAIKGWVNRGKKEGTWADAVRLAASAAVPIRFGAYGEPGIVDPAGTAWACRQCQEACIPYMGYTHAWSRPEVAAELRGLMMASCDSPESARVAIAAGWKVAMVSPHSLNRPEYAAADAKKLPKAVACPAQQKGLHCNKCRLCDGNRVNIVFHEH